MSEIIDLTAFRAARRKLLSVGETHAKSEGDAMAHRVRSDEPVRPPADPQESRARRCDAILAGIKKDKIMSPQQRRLVAGNLWKLLDRLERDHGVTRRDVISHAGVDVDSESTKRLYKLTLPLDLPATEAKKRTDTLNRSPREYLRIARSAAELIGTHEAETVTEVFAGSRYDQTNAGADRQFDEHLYAMVDLLVDLAWHVDQETPLWDYYGRLFRLSCKWVERADQFQRSDEPVSLMFPTWMADNFALYETAPPAPSVRLYKELRCTPFGASLHVSKARRGDFQDSDHWPATPVTVRAWREVRLSLGPTTGPLAIGPLFEVRTVIEILSNQKAIEADFPYLDGGSGAWLKIYRSSQLYPAVLKYDDPAFVIPRDAWEDDRIFDPDPHRTHSLEHHYFLYVPVTAQTCDLLLVKPPLTLPDEVRHDISRESFLPHTSNPTKFPHGTIGQELESALIDRASSVRGLVHQLLQDAKDKVTKLNTYESQYNAEVSRLHAGARSRWRRGTDEDGK